MTSSIVRWPNFCTSMARFLSKSPRKASSACRSAASSSLGWSLLASFSALPASYTMSLAPFLRFFSTAQASSLTDPMPKRVRRASLASSQVAASSRLERMRDPLALIRSWHHVILLVSSSTSPSWKRRSSSANQLDKTCWRWSYFSITLTMEFILFSEMYTQLI